MILGRGSQLVYACADVAGQVEKAETKVRKPKYGSEKKSRLSVATSLLAYTLYTAANVIRALLPSRSK